MTSPTRRSPARRIVRTTLCFTAGGAAFGALLSWWADAAHVHEPGTPWTQAQMARPLTTSAHVTHALVPTVLTWAALATYVGFMFAAALLGAGSAQQQGISTKRVALMTWHRHSGSGHRW